MNCISSSFVFVRLTQESRLSISKLRLLKDITSTYFEESVETEVEHLKDTQILNSTVDSRDVAIYEEETRMSADVGSSRAQTPAKQVSYCRG